MSSALIKNYTSANYLMFFLAFSLLFFIFTEIILKKIKNR